MKKENTYFYEMKPVLLNVLSFVLLFIMLLITYLIIFIFNLKFSFTNIDYIVILVLFIPYFIFHEILHSIGYVVNGAKFKNITYGMHLEKGILCCSCKEVINKKNIMWSLMYPFLFIGVLTYIIGIIFNIPTLILLSITNISGCTGDLIMFIDFYKFKDIKFFEYDNPLAFGIITNEDINNKKMYGLKRIEENNFEQTIDKKITISKTSIIFLVIYFILFLINLLGLFI